MSGGKTRTMKAWQKEENTRILQEMQRRYPVFFGQANGKPVPGRIGIAEDLATVVIEGETPKAMERFKRFWFGLVDYTDALTRGGPRYRLDGTTDGEVTAEDVEAAVRKLASILFEGLNAKDSARRKRMEKHHKRLRPTPVVREEIERLAAQARAEGRTVIWPSADKKPDRAPGSKVPSAA